LSVLANEVYEYLKKTGHQVDKYRLQTKFMVNNHVMTEAIIELGSKLNSTRQGSHRVYWVPKQATAEPINHFVMKPYRQPDLMTERFREIEEQKAAFPSRFN